MRGSISAILIVAGTTQALAADDICNVHQGCLQAITEMAANAKYGYSTEKAGSGETASLMWCQLAMTVYSWRRPGVDAGRALDIYLPTNAVRENERMPGGRIRPIAWTTTAAAISQCAEDLKIADSAKAAAARVAAAEWAKSIVLGPEPLEPPDIVPLPPH